MSHDAISNPQKPSHVPDQLVTDLDYLAGVDVLTDPFATFDSHVRRQPIVWSPRWGGHWIILGSDEVREALRDPDLFSNSETGIPYIAESLFGPRPMIPEQLDPPEHLKYRRVLAPFFAPAAVEHLMDHIDKVARELIATLKPRGSCEFIQDFAQPLPTKIFLALLDLPEENADTFRGWVHDLIYRPDDIPRAIAAGTSARRYLEQTVAERASSPGDDLVSQLLASEVDGQKLTTDEVYDICILLFLAGLDTVTSALGLAWRELASNPALRRSLVEDESKINDVVEELLRINTFSNLPRRVTRDDEFAGVSMKAGEMVLISLVAANRDPNAWDSPDRVMVSSGTRSHLAFGAGPHRCLGSHLARREITHAIRLWLEQIPDFGIAPESTVSMHAGTNMGVNALQLRWVVS